MSARDRSCRLTASTTVSQDWIRGTGAPTCGSRQAVFFFFFGWLMCYQVLGFPSNHPFLGTTAVHLACGGHPHHRVETAGPAAKNPGNRSVFLNCRRFDNSTLRLTFQPRQPIDGMSITLPVESVVSSWQAEVTWHECAKKS